MKREMPSFFRSLLWQMISRVVCILMVMLIAMSISQYYLLKTSLYNSAGQLLLSRFHNVLVEDIVKIQSQEQLKAASAGFISTMIDTSVSVTVIDSSGQIIAESDSASRDAFGDNLLAEEHDMLQQTVLIPHLTPEKYISQNSSPGIIDIYTVMKNSDGQPFLVQLFKIGNPAQSTGLIQLSTPLTTINNVLNRQLINFVLVSLAALTVGMAAIVFLLKKILRPLSKITEAVSLVSADKLDTKIPSYKSSVETDKLSDAFNAMLDRINLSFTIEQKTKAQMQQFLSDASHELRTPLTAIHGLAEVVSMGAAKDEAQLTLALHSIMSESERLERMVNDLLTLTKLDQQIPIPMEPESLSGILEEIYPSAVIMAGTKTLTYDIQNDLPIMGSRDLLKQVIWNLVQNAFQHTSALGRISVSLDTLAIEAKQYLELSVQDDGYGIPEDSLPYIFDRFYRADSHRARMAGGAGLGLAIVKDIVEQHSGTITVESEVEKGTKVIILLPAIQPRRE